MKSLKFTFNLRLSIYFFSIFLIFSAIVILFQYSREKDFRVETLNTLLGASNNIVCDYIKRNPDNINRLDSVVGMLAIKDIRVSVLNLAGDVIYDNGIDNIKTMTNHKMRPEIVLCDEVGHGYNIRMSESVNEDFYYYASKYESCYVRSALPYNIDLVSLLKEDHSFLYFMIAVTIVTLLIVLLISNMLGDIISKLRNFAAQAELDLPLDVNVQFPDDELGDISRSIVFNYKKMKRAKDALAKEKEKLFLHLQITKEGLAIFTAESKEILANSNFLQYANVISDTCIVSAEDIFKKNDFKAISEYLADCQNKMACAPLIQSIRKNGRAFTVQCVMFSDGSFEVSIVDVTIMEKEQQLKKELTQNIAHELKTPVCSILGYMETLTENPDMEGEKRNFFIERSFVQTKRLSSLLQDITLLNKMDDYAASFDCSGVNVAVVVECVLNDLSLLLSEHNIKCEVEMDKNVVICGNEQLVYSIFKNLTDNSIAYAGDGVYINVSCYKEDEDFYYFSYSDTGIGVNDEHLSRLFERFYRIDKGRSRKIGGTGLGLAIVKNAVVTHGGSIIAKKRQGGGLEFIFSLKKMKG